MKFTKILAIFSVFIAVAVLSSCRKELCYNHFRAADLKLSWEQEWERDYGMSHATTWDKDLHGFDYSDLRPSQPEWVNLIKYDKGISQEEVLLNAKGGLVPVEGTTDLSFLLYNGDTEYIVFSEMAALSEARASTTARYRPNFQYMSPLFPDTRSSNPPDVLFASYIENVPDIEMHEKKLMPIKMQPLVYTYHIRYEFEEGLQFVALARGALGGMAESVYIRNGVTSEETTTILFDCDVKDYGCEAQVGSFGIPAFPDEYYGRSPLSRASNTYTLNLEIKLKNGKSTIFNFDVADQIKNQPRGGVLIVRNIKVPHELAGSNSGFEVGIDDWGDHEDIDLPIGPKK